MLGTSRVQVRDLSQVALDPLDKFGAGTFYQWNVSHPYVSTADTFSLASEQTHGRGILSSSNKPSERNIYNVPLFISVNQYALQMPVPNAWRIFSYTAMSPTTRPGG